MSATSKRLLLLFASVILLIGGIYIYRSLFPSGPNLTPLPNPIIDRASQDWQAKEQQLTSNPLRNLYWGDLHVHTSFSFDAYIGGTRATPDDAYLFAKGENIQVYGEAVKLQRPLDFAAVTDHAEYLGEMYTVRTKGSKGYGAMVPRYLRSIGLDTVKQRKFFDLLSGRNNKGGRNHQAFFQGFQTTATAWDKILEAAENHYAPGQFTTFAAYEWSLGLDKGHLHRNIIFKDMLVPTYPLSSLEAKVAEELWEWLAEISDAGATVMAIPHNTNISQGGTFRDTTSAGLPIDAAYAQMSATFEPLVEIHQAKGNSEVHAGLWSNDEFANFENYTLLPLNEHSYVRYALKRGLEHEAKLGINPHKYGFIGSTDTHNASPGNTEEEDVYIGNHATVDFLPERRRSARWVLDRSYKPFQTINPGGLVAVWAEANTRSHIYDALHRKESYATSGTRIQVRFFGGYQLKQVQTYDEMVQAGYMDGVSMGNDLPDLQGNGPQFYIWAAKDPESAPLDRIQMVKGWYKDGKMQEKIYDIVASDNRQVDAKGKVVPLQAEVNTETAAYAEGVGASSFLTVWKDPDFDPTAKAFYYVRVLEIPTARWTLWDKVRYGTEFPDGTSMVIQERAWSSPIWYSPK